MLGGVFCDFLAVLGAVFLAGAIAVAAAIVRGVPQAEVVTGKFVMVVSVLLKSVLLCALRLWMIVLQRLSLWRTYVLGAA